MSVLTDSERSCLSRYVALLADTLGKRLREVLIFGSVARGERWPRGMPIRSDLDLVVLLESPVPESVMQELLDATLPLFLECGRQISPQFRTSEQFDADDERARVFRGHLARDGVSVYRRS